jgi:hypothetical protein
MGFTVNKHYCMGRLMDIAINHDADTCTDMDFEDPMPCCDDHSEELKIEEITKVSFNFDSQPQLYTIAIVTLFIADLEPFEANQDTPSHQHYSPPPPDIDYQTDHQVFLI